MKIGFIIIGALVVITIFLSSFFSLHFNTRQVFDRKTNSSMLYSKKALRKIAVQSNIAGKQNCPFLDCDIFQTIDNGTKTINALGNMFEGITNYETKPRW